MPQVRIFYGWWIVLAGVIVALLQGMFYVYGFGVFYLPLLAAMGTTRAALGGVIGLSRLEGGLISPVAGWLIDTYGPRRLMFLSLAILGLGFIALSQVTALWMLYVVFLVMSAGSSLGSTRAVNIAVVNWFVRKRGLALGILTAGFGLGGSLGWALAWIIGTYGWQTASVIAGLTFMVVGFPLTLVVRHRPEEMGLRPDGVPAQEKGRGPGAEMEGGGEGRAGGPETASSAADFTPRQALASPAFWLLALAFGGWSTIVTVVTVYQVPFFTEEMHVPFVQAAAVASLFPAISVGARLGFGWLGDRANPRLLLVGIFLLMAAGLVVLSRLPSLAWAPLYLLLLAPAYGGAIPLRSLIVANFFGRRNFGTISGFMQLVDLPGSVLGPVFLGWVFDTFGSYRPGFLVIAALTGVGTLALLATRQPRLRPLLVPAA